MNYTVMAYTRRENRELESAMHLAAVLENGSLQPLQNGTGILFAKAEFNEGPLVRHHENPAEAMGVPPEGWSLRRGMPGAAT